LESKAEILKAIANPIRLCILNCLMSSGDCNVTTLSQTLGQRQSTISQHISKLKSQGIVSGKRTKQEINYSISTPEYQELLSFILKDIPN
jgi:ArsR family transcriptional regulator